MRKLVFICLMYLVSSSFGASLVQYIDSDVAGGTGDGSSWENAYATIALWEAQNLNLTDGGGDTLTVYCRGTTDNAKVNISGWTTNESCTITIKGNNTSGVWDADCYTIDGGTDYSDPAINIAVGFITLENLQIYKTNTTAADAARLCVSYNESIPSGSSETIKNCIIKTKNISTAGGSISSINIRRSVTFNIINNIIYSEQTKYMDKAIETDSSASAPILNVYNNSIINISTGIYVGNAGATVCVKNNIFNDVVADVVGIDVADTNLTNIAEAASGMNGKGTGNVFNTSLTFANDAAYDYHLSASDTAAINAGTDLSSIFTTDIDGVTRTGTWDIGADEYVAAAHAALVPFLHPVMTWEN